MSERAVAALLLLLHVTQVCKWWNKCKHVAPTHTNTNTLSQCDQIGRFIGLWATFQIICQQLISPISHILRQFMSKCLIFLVKSFLGNFYRHSATFYWSHCSLALALFHSRKITHAMWYPPNSLIYCTLTLSFFLSFFCSYQYLPRYLPERWNIQSRHHL